jgi:hypothetical protein
MHMRYLKIALFAWVLAWLIFPAANSSRASAKLEAAPARVSPFSSSPFARTGDTVPFECDVSIRNSIDDPVERDYFVFSAADNERVHITFANGTPAGPNFGMVWRLLKGDGTPATECGDISGAARDCGPLPAAGNPYRIEVSDFQFNGTGSYTLAANFLTTGCSAITLAPNPLTVAVGTSGNLTVTMTPVQATDTVVGLSSANAGVAKAPDSVTISANQSSATFTVMGMAAGATNITATLPASLGGRTATAGVAVFGTGHGSNRNSPAQPDHERFHPCQDCRQLAEYLCAAQSRADDGGQ